MRKAAAPRNFMAWLGVGSGVIFALVILNQLPRPDDQSMPALRWLCALLLTLAARRQRP
jgi:hypothetical protein